MDNSNINEAESTLHESGCLNYEEARALLGRLEYQKGNFEAALHVFEGIGIDAITPIMKVSCLLCQFMLLVYFLKLFYPRQNHCRMLTSFKMLLDHANTILTPMNLHYQKVGLKTLFQTEKYKKPQQVQYNSRS